MVIIIALAFILCTLVFGAFAYQKIKDLNKVVAASWAALDVPLRYRQECALAVASLIASLNNVSDYYDRAAMIKTDCHAEILFSDRVKREQYLTRLIDEMRAYAAANANIKSSIIYNEQMELLAKHTANINARAATYNEAVRDYDTLVSSIPVIIIAKMFDFKEKVYFELITENHA